MEKTVLASRETRISNMGHLCSGIGLTAAVVGMAKNGYPRRDQELEKARFAT